MPELIDDGTTGFLVGTIEEAVDAVDAAGRLDRTAIRASAVERFDVSRMIERYVAVYSDILTSASGGRSHPRQRG
jgi:glycosyltransferase involved in cell wall biosynthesis